MLFGTENGLFFFFGRLYYCINIYCVFAKENKDKSL